MDTAEPERSGKMTYNDLKIYIEKFHTGKISKKELAIAIAMWQRNQPPETIWTVI